MSVYANRGMGLETLIEHANAQYASKGIAQIQKVATPWKVIRKGKQIVSAFPEKKSTVDFIGVYQGKAICFDVKQTENKTSFPFSNIEPHQIDFMLKWERTGGIAFFLIEFKEHREIYFIPFKDFMSYYTNEIQRKSLKYETAKTFPRVRSHNGILLDYLKEVG